ncbi:NAD/NADH kinase [Schizosaccharomyces cryophilus OY26]|uniref:NAD/NADH kinase n=1 Tax=Schizosaccharomyces cryophilus (strain OY26 / ATCC MYA-4695 / CBS 11777 / NBRC 106824 / NRRL Y48691) TaxID=653667 RepID=S9XGF5_SCHCR|nr:NAD/NADH kinase [Schizosaccharomyces cryophilus OY26]EPY52761.1 NAD/NADH kinase [Schizosaccharomyces cryophilus OY26]
MDPNNRHSISDLPNAAVQKNPDSSGTFPGFEIPDNRTSMSKSFSNLSMTSHHGSHDLSMEYTRSPSTVRSSKIRWARRNPRFDPDKRKRQYDRVKHSASNNCKLHLSLQNHAAAQLRSDSLLLQANDKRDLTSLVTRVKELAAKLSAARLTFRFRRVLLISNDDSNSVKAAVQLAQWLLDNFVESSAQQDFDSESKGSQAQMSSSDSNDRSESPPFLEMDCSSAKNIKSQFLIYLEDKLYSLPEGENLVPKENVRFWSAELCTQQPNVFDCVITIGDDTTALRASWLFQDVVPPVISYSVANPGFLSVLPINDYQQTLDVIFRKGFTVNLRMRFQCSIMRYVGEKKTHICEGQFSVLNELLIDRGPNPFMIMLDLYVDNEYITCLQSDGVCVSTPTGSTAYSVAAGGSLCHPGIPAILISAICPHSLSFRPIILPDSMTLRIVVPLDARSNAWCAFDGHHRVELGLGDYISVSASPFPFPSFNRYKNSTDWFDVLRHTLNWNDRKNRQRAHHSKQFGLGLQGFMSK